MNNSGGTTGRMQSKWSDIASFFDVVLVDEAAQCLEVACWIPLLCGKR